MPVGKAVHGELLPGEILADGVFHPVGQGLLQGGPVVDAPGAYGALAHRGLDEHRVLPDLLRTGIEAGQIFRAPEIVIGQVLGAADLHRLQGRSHHLGMQPVLFPGQGKHRAVMGGINIVDGEFIDHLVEPVDQPRLVHIGQALHAVFKHKIRMAGHAGGAVELDKLAVAQRMMDLKGDLRPGGEHQHLPDLSHGNSLLCRTAPVQQIFQN